MHAGTRIVSAAGASVMRYLHTVAIVTDPAGPIRVNNPSKH